MKESQFGFEYSWADLQPIRPLAITVIAAQVLGAAVGLAAPQFPHWFESLWFGAALATFPAFVVGALLQTKLRPGTLSESRVMVRRLGMIALLLSVIAVAMSVLGWGRAP